MAGRSDEWGKQPPNISDRWFRRAVGESDPARTGAAQLLRPDISPSAYAGHLGRAAVPLVSHSKRRAVS